MLLQQPAEIQFFSHIYGSHRNNKPPITQMARRLQAPLTSNIEGDLPQKRFEGITPRSCPGSILRVTTKPFVQNGT